MGFKKTWDVVQIKGQLRSMAWSCSSPFNDGFITSDIKRDMVEIKFLLDDLLATCPKYAGEEEWYHERLLNKLGKKNED